MSQSLHSEVILRNAKEKEKEYDWLGAAESFKKALDLVSEKDFLKREQILERISYCLYRAAFQAETREKFRIHMQSAVEAYERTAGLLKRVNEAKGSSEKILHCMAMAAYVGYWLAVDPDTKRQLLDKCRNLEKEALKRYGDAGNRLGLGKECIGLTICLIDRLDLELDTRIRKGILDEAISHGEKAIEIFSEVGDEHELSRAYCMTSIHCENAAMSLQLENKRRECGQKAFDYAKEAIRISGMTGDKFLLGRSTAWLGFAEDDLGAGSEIASGIFKKALQYGVGTKDHLLLSEAFDGLAFATAWGLILEEDLEKMRERSRKCEEYASEAIRNSVLVNYGHGIPHSYSAYVQNFTQLARREIKSQAKRKLVEKAVTLGKQGLEHAKSAGSTHAFYHVSYGLADALYFLSAMKTGVEKKKSLEEALMLGEKAVYYGKQLRPLYMLPQAYTYETLAMILFELSKLEERREKRKQFLEKSVSHMRKCITYLQSHLASFPERKEVFAFLGRVHTQLGNILDQLHQTTSEGRVLRKLIEAYQGATQMNRKAGLFCRVAEAYWQIAKAHNQLANYSESAKNFESASENYILAAEKMPQLMGFYSDYELYMRAWAELERSRHEHENENYARSREHYRACSHLLEMTKKWSYLSSYYFAWSLLEHGEALSRLDKPQDSIKAFDEAGRTFGDFANSLREQVEELEDSEERDEAAKLANVAGLRRQYCMGRVLMEEAALCNRMGDRVSSAKKYASAAGSFKEIAPNLEREEAREELQFAAAICEAWEKMELAEERGDAVLYKKAAELFTKAGKIGPRKTAELTAMGNSCFCEALEMGMEFMATSNTDFYSGAKLRMENAAGYYQRAGFDKPALWVEATKRLFDAYVYVGKAEAEAEPEKRVKFYLMAEKCLELSAKFYGKAGYRGKKNEVLQSLERTRKEREFAFSLSEVLTAPATLSSTTRVSMPDLTEKAAGLNEFESVNIRAHVSVPEEFIPGEEFQVKLDLVNVGKKPGLLVRIDDLVPPRCEVLRLPSYCALEGASLNMKGRRLDPLSAESVNVWVQIADIVGVSLSPRVVYVDDVGTFRTCKPEPVYMTVHPRFIFEFTAKDAQSIFDYLVGSFAEDYMKRRISLEKSGWRTLMKIIKGGKVSRSSVYAARGGRGPAMCELERRGLVEARVFPGERGRGGKIIKMRIYYEKETIKRYTDQHIMKNR